MPCWRGSGPSDAISLSVMPEVRNWPKPPSPSGPPGAAYRACASSRALSTSRCRTSSTDSSAATASTASLSALSVGVVGSVTALTIRLRSRAVAATGEAALQYRVLESLATARNYIAWLSSLARPYLGDDPLEIGSGAGDYAAARLAAGAERLTVTEA